MSSPAGLLLPYSLISGQIKHFIRHEKAVGNDFNKPKLKLGLTDTMTSA